MAKDGLTEFDDLLLSRARLGVLTALMRGDKLEFVYLRKTLQLSDGNLSVQIRKLEDAGYIKVKKEFVNRKPKTFCKITAKGRNTLVRFVERLGDIVESG